MTFSHLFFTLLYYLYYHRRTNTCFSLKPIMATPTVSCIWNQTYRRFPAFIYKHANDFLFFFRKANIPTIPTKIKLYSNLNTHGFWLSFRLDITHIDMSKCFYVFRWLNTDNMSIYLTNIWFLINHFFVSSFTWIKIGTFDKIDCCFSLRFIQSHYK